MPLNGGIPKADHAWLQQAFQRKVPLDSDSDILANCWERIRALNFIFVSDQVSRRHSARDVSERHHLSLLCPCIMSNG